VDRISSTYFACVLHGTQGASDETPLYVDYPEPAGAVAQPGVEACPAQAQEFALALENATLGDQLLTAEGQLCGCFLTTTAASLVALMPCNGTLKQMQ